MKRDRIKTLLLAEALICALLALVGLFIMAALYLHHVKGAILLGILATWILSLIHL